MDPSCVNFLSGILETHVGDPLADGLEGLPHCISADRLVGRSGLAVGDTIDEQVAEAGFWIVDSTEGWILVESATEIDPAPEGIVFGFPGLGRGSGRGDSQRSAESSGETNSLERVSRVQGSVCGYFCSKWARKAVSESCWSREESSDMMLSGPGR